MATYCDRVAGHFETPLDIARSWVEIPLPLGDDDTADAAPIEVLRADLTWLTSSWTCIFGRGCQGIYRERPTDGCCTLGAHFTDDADVERVAAWAERMTDEQWQRREFGRDRAWLVDGATRIVDGACVFLNDPDFAGGSGCALHHAAGAAGVEPLESKPDVCWQLPLRRTYRTVERPDGTSYQEVSIGEYDRRGWGPGGHDLDWYCTGNPAAHIGSRPVFVSLEPELRQLVGDVGYELLAEACREAMSVRRLLPLTVLTHPATALAQQAAEEAGGE